MFMKNEISFTPRPVVIALFVLSIGLVYSQFAASCGSYCKARQVRDFCQEIVKSKGLTGDRRDVEFDRCKIDPMTYKQIDELVDDTTDSLE
jgi:hypothetical protein